MVFLKTASKQKLLIMKKAILFAALSFILCVPSISAQGDKRECEKERKGKDHFVVSDLQSGGYLPVADNISATTGVAVRYDLREKGTSRKTFRGFLRIDYLNST